MKTGCDFVYRSMSIFGRHDIIASLASLQRYARALTRDHGRAEDLVHDALLRAMERASTYRDGDNLSGWLRAILHNTFIDQRRRTAADARRAGDVAGTAANEAAPPQDAHLQLQDTMRAFEALPDEQRAALYLVAVEDLSYAEAAETLGIPLGTLMSRIGRARAALRATEDRNDQPGVAALSGGRPRLVSVRHD